MFGSIGLPEIILIMLVVLLLFGPDKLPDFAKTFGKTVREFKKTLNDAKATIEDEIEKAEVATDIKDIKHEIKQISTLEVDDPYTKANPSEQNPN